MKHIQNCIKILISNCILINNLIETMESGFFTNYCADFFSLPNVVLFVGTSVPNNYLFLQQNLLPGLSTSGAQHQMLYFNKQPG